jgi:hypothetical protein
LIDLGVNDLSEPLEVAARLTKLCLTERIFLLYNHVLTERLHTVAYLILSSLKVSEAEVVPVNG